MTDDPDGKVPVERRSVLRALGSGLGVSAAGFGGRLTSHTGGGGTGVDGTTNASYSMAAARTEFYSQRAVAGKGECFRPNQREIYGPTDINAQTGNGGLSVALNDAGTMTVFRWPHPSFYDQLKYFTLGRDADDEIEVLPNEGAFLGLARDDGDGFETTWLRDADVEQYYASDAGDTDADYSDEVVTVYAPGDRVRVVVRDLVAADVDALIRRVQVVWQGPPHERPEMRLVAYENCNLVVSKNPQYPTQDWCTEETNQDLAQYQSGSDAIVHQKTGPDVSTGEQQSVAVAMGFRGESAGHQVGGDAYEPAAAPVGQAGPTRDAYDDAATLPLFGNGQYAGQTTGALTADLSFTGNKATESVVFTAAHTANEATATLEKLRGRSFDDVRAAKESWFSGLLADAPLPDTDDETLLALCRRALVTLVTDTESTENRAVVASIATQAPYGEDWIRDGAYFNFAFDLLGLDDWVADRNRWYADIQQRADDPRPTHPNTPPGNWAMNYYGDGVAGGPIPYEIDETGYGIWTMWDYYEQTGDGDYLTDVYPAIRRAADFLVRCRDVETNLHCPTWEDDRFQPQRPTIVGAALVWLGLKAAKEAAREFGNNGDASRYETRQHEVGQAIDRHLYGDISGNGDLGYGTRIGFPMAEVAWPVCFTPYYNPDTDEIESTPVQTYVGNPLDHPRIRSHMDASWNAISPAFEEPGGPGSDTGQYEVKGLLPLAKARRESGKGTLEEVREGIDWLATRHATEDTHVMGEAWKVFDGANGEPEVRSIVSQPHAWEQVLVYLAALEAYPPVGEFEEGTCGSVLAALRRD